MSGWSEGYVHELGYTYGYYSDFNPLNVEFSLLAAGYRPPKIETACELGFGQGVSLSTHAACSKVRWYGNDFNPTQAGFAKELVEVSGSNAYVSDASFREFCSDPNLPNFDFIGLHGVWSWVSDENRSLIIEFISQKLNVGGVLFVSYNALPGWYSMMPIRHMMTQHVERMGRRGAGTEENISEALAFYEQLIGKTPRLLSNLPHLDKRFEDLCKRDKSYLAHEYFNSSWQPMYFSEVSDLLEPTKLSFVTSSHYPDTVARLNYKPESDSAFAGLSDTCMRETVHDFVVNRTFRRDYWVKGPRKLSSLQQVKKLSDIDVSLLTVASDIDLSIETETLKNGLVDHIYSPIIDILSDLKPHSIGSIIEKVSEHNVSIGHVVQALGILKAKSDLCISQKTEVIDEVMPQVDRINQFLIDKAIDNAPLAVLANPSSGGALQLNRVEQMFSRMYKDGIDFPLDAASKLFEILQSQNQSLVINGKQVAMDEDGLESLQKLAKEFQDKRLPILVNQRML